MSSDKPKLGLGRGLGALIGPAAGASLAFTSQKSEPAKEENVFTSGSSEALNTLRMIDPQKIRVNAEQPRTVFADDALDELAESIREHGILQPLVVTETAPGEYELIAGERRLRAAKRLGLARIPVTVRPSAALKDKLVLALIENIQRQDLNAVEEGRGYRRLSEEYGLSHEEIASRVGKSRSAVTNAMRLLDLDSDMLAALEEGRITKSHARTLLAEPVPTLRQSLFAKMLGGGVTVREAEARAGTRSRSFVPGIKDANVVALEGALREKLGTKVVLEHRGGPGKITISYYSKEDLRRIVQTITGEKEE
jgi:ParB family transcriptional regulator, chromosome partitioning protein